MMGVSLCKNGSHIRRNAFFNLKIPTLQAAFANNRPVQIQRYSSRG
jgi:hypothetical protein